MTCKKCKQEIPSGSTFCMYCGWKQNKDRQNRKRRGNGQGSVYRLPSGKWRAVVTLGYEIKGVKMVPVQVSKSIFKTKKEALDYLPLLRSKPKNIDRDITFKGLFEIWFPTHQRSRGTNDCYKSAFKQFAAIHYLKFNEIGIDDLQNCIDECGKGKRTRQNMKVLANLLYKYAIPRGYSIEKLNLASFLKPGDGTVGVRAAFPQSYIKAIIDSAGIVPYADMIYILMYTGFRPQEFLDLDIRNYNCEENCFIGGGKTEAGTNRYVTVSPRILPFVEKYTGHKENGRIFTDEFGAPLSLPKFRDRFYAALEQIGLENPILAESGVHKYTPYSCRHTFATLMDKIPGSKKAKLELMGHTSEEMLRHYQHVDYESIREITDRL